MYGFEWSFTVSFTVRNVVRCNFEEWYWKGRKWRPKGKVGVDRINLYFQSLSFLCRTGLPFVAKRSDLYRRCGPVVRSHPDGQSGPLMLALGMDYSAKRLMLTPAT